MSVMRRGAGGLAAFRLPTKASVRFRGSEDQKLTDSQEREDMQLYDNKAGRQP